MTGLFYLFLMAVVVGGMFQGFLKSANDSK